MRFYLLRGDEPKSATQSGWDNRKGGIAVMDFSQAVRAVFDLASGVEFKQTNKPNRILAAREGILIIGRLGGDGTGPNRSFVTKQVTVKEFVLKGNELLLVAEAEYAGPFLNGEPHPQAIYFSAEVKTLPVGKYQISLKVEPRGKVYQDWKNSRDIRLPDYPPMTATFEVVK